MDHARIKNMLSEYRDGELSSGDRLSVDEHLCACAECRKFLKNWDTLSSHLFVHPPLRPARDLSRDVLERLGTARPKTHLRPIVRLAPALGIAAVLVLSLVPARMLSLPSGPAVSSEEVYRFLFTDEGTDSQALDLMLD